MCKWLIAVVLAVTGIAQGEILKTGAAGCGNNVIGCLAIPVSNGMALTFEGIGMNNGKPFLAPGYWRLCAPSGRCTYGHFTAVRTMYLPNPVPTYRLFHFQLVLSAPGMDVVLGMQGYKGRFGVTNYSTTGGYMSLWH